MVPRTSLVVSRIAYPVWTGGRRLGIQKMVGKKNDARVGRLGAAQVVGLECDRAEEGLAPWREGGIRAYMRIE